jgi:hypothetical protein
MIWLPLFPKGYSDMKMNVWVLQTDGFTVFPFLATCFNFSSRFFSKSDTAGDEATPTMNKAMHNMGIIVIFGSSTERDARDERHMRLREKGEF